MPFFDFIKKKNPTSTIYNETGDAEAPLEQYFAAPTFFCSTSTYACLSPPCLAYQSSCLFQSSERRSFMGCCCIFPPLQVARLRKKPRDADWCRYTGLYIIMRTLTSRLTGGTWISQICHPHYGLWQESNALNWPPRGNALNAEIAFIHFIGSLLQPLAFSLPLTLLLLPNFSYRYHDLQYY